MFAERGLDMLLSQSYAKNMGLYGERVGALHIVTPNKETSSRVLSQVKMVIRAEYSSPPLGGARIADRILNNEGNFEEWSRELKSIAERVISMRKGLRAKL
jgi:aspartate/tyrosine/aromatic aminotransferase